MRILAVDPGTEQSAFVLWDGAVRDRGVVANNDFVRDLRRTKLVEDSTLVIEKVESFGMPVGKETFRTVFWSGCFCEAWNARGGPYIEMPRRQVKLHICGHARATDANIRQALIDRIGPIGTKKNQGPLYGLKGHEFAALAVAVTYYDQHSGESRT